LDRQELFLEIRAKARGDWPAQLGARPPRRSVFLTTFLIRSWTMDQMRSPAGSALVCLAALAALAACSSATPGAAPPAADAGPDAGPDGGSDASLAPEHAPPADGDVLYNACAPGTRTGWFRIEAAAPDTHALFHGLVVTPRFHEDGAVQTAGNCRLMRASGALQCPSTCPQSQWCFADDGTCMPLYSAHSVGTVRVDGVQNPVEISQPYEADPGAVPWPAAAPGTLLTLHAAGGEYAPFTLYGRAVTPLILPPDALRVTRDQPLTITWSPADPASGARIEADIDLGNNAGLDRGSVSSGTIACDFPDTGSAEVPSSLLGTLFDMGVGSGPQMILRRHTVDSIDLAPGCVDFVVESATLRAITLN